MAEINRYLITIIIITFVVDVVIIEVIIIIIYIATFVLRGVSPGCRLFSTASMLVWLRNRRLPLPLTGEQYGKMERNTLRVVTARVFYVLGVF